MERPFLIACHDCDLLQKIPPVPEGGQARCPRCGAGLYSHKRNSLDRTISLVVAGLILFFLSNAFPLLELKSQGLMQDTTLYQGVKALYDQDMKGLSVLVFLTCIVVPFVQLSGLFYVLLPLKYNRLAPRTPAVFRFIRKLQPWSMMEVFMLGILVSIVKLAKMASIIPGISLYSFGALIIVLAWAAATLDPHIVWERLGGGRR
ncbi:MAG: paraquat-inducible protein A [Desulfobacteraceae bacterium]|nr:MAG: paraquat-inducible protein A [Desulfobacteraceae bacterium]